MVGLCALLGRLVPNAAIKNKNGGCWLSKRFLNPTFLFASCDFALGIAAFYLASLIRFQLDLDTAAVIVGPLLPRAICFAAAVMLGLLVMGLYRARQRPKHWEAAARVMIGVVIGSACFIMLFYLVPYLTSGRGVLIGAAVISCILLSAGRVFLLGFMDKNPVKTKILVLGTGANALKIGRLRRASDRRRFEIIGYAALAEADQLTAEQNPELRPVISRANIVDYPGVDEVVVALDERRGILPIEALLRFKGRGVPVTDVIDFLERETGKIDLDLLSPAWFVYTPAGYTDRLFRVSKRFVDISVSALVFTITSPIFAFVILSIWLEDGIGTSTMYRQRRVGRAGVPFELLKFRSMRTNAESSTGPRWAVQNDDRVTRVGKIIRRFRVDELPQLFNVLRGEMSIVGPRPERPEFVEMLTNEIPLFNVRHNMRPGLAGWAQLNFPYGGSIRDAQEKLSYDIYYIKNASLTLDVLIFLQTIEVVVWGKATSMAGPPRENPLRENDTPDNHHVGRRQKDVTTLNDGSTDTDIETGPKKNLREPG
jgi:sugar transferase (PEP-CTERM system associated)